MQSTDGRVRPQPGATPVSHRWALLLGASGASLIALTVAAQIYLSMLHHGHSFIRIALWQLLSWSVWAAATPAVSRLGATLTGRPAPLAGRAMRVAATGLLIVSAHIVLASVATVWLQPYTPVETFRLGGALILQTLSLPVDLLVYGLLLVIGASLAVYERARSLELRESRLEADLTRAQLDALRLEMLALILQGIGTNTLPARKGQFASDVHVVEMAVKDTGRVPEGWAYYAFGGPMAGGYQSSAAPQPKSSCHSCHAEHAARDNVFTQFYGLLNEAAPRGK